MVWPRSVRSYNSLCKGGFVVRGKVEQVWNPKQQQNDQVITTNRFEALGDTESVPKKGENKNREELPTKKDTTRENMGQEKTPVANNGKTKTPILENKGEINQRFEERKKDDDEGPHMGQAEGHSQTGESDTHNLVQEILKAPVIDKLTEQEKTNKKDTKEDECMERNIESIGREGDLSPWQINQLRGKNKKWEKLQTQSQINTRSKKGSTSTSNK
uniref:Uncharacterized protein n=1 Tax=Solanum tuberosum TaxID=4113 RepID=M1DG36_SOLTU